MCHGRSPSIPARGQNHPTTVTTVLLPAGTFGRMATLEEAANTSECPADAPRDRTKSLSPRSKARVARELVDHRITGSCGGRIALNFDKPPDARLIVKNRHDPAPSNARVWLLYRTTHFHMLAMKSTQKNCKSARPLRRLGPTTEEQECWVPEKPVSSAKGRPP